MSGAPPLGDAAKKVLVVLAVVAISWAVHIQLRHIRISETERDTIDEITALMAPGADVLMAKMRLLNARLKTVSEAAYLCDVLRSFPAADRGIPGRDSRLSALVRLMLVPHSEDVRDELRSRGIPELCRIFDELLATNQVADEQPVMVVLRALAAYRTEEGTERVLRAARLRLQATDNMAWIAVFRAYDVDHPHTQRVVEELHDALGTDAVSVGLLTFVNELARSGAEIAHPFDCERGVTLLRDWLASSDEADYGCAQSAAMCLAFIDAPERDQLFELADRHPHPMVQMEAAWAAATLGREGGIQTLQEFALDPPNSKFAIAFLEELDREDDIPSEASDPDFQALAEMAVWLAHPSEMGRPADELTLYDHRELFWPPTNDRREVWLFKYRYEPRSGDEEVTEGLGMVGSVTFALFGTATVDMTPIEAYGLHCTWEFRWSGDERSATCQTTEQGVALLRKHNDDL